MSEATRTPYSFARTMDRMLTYGPFGTSGLYHTTLGEWNTCEEVYLGGHDEVVFGEAADGSGR